MDLKGKKVLVVGLARTGAAAVQFLSKRGAKVKVSDAKTAAELAPFLGPLQGLSVEWELGGHTESFFADADLIVMSPGVPLNLPAVEKSRAKGIPVVSEVELAFRFLRRPLIAITGTNGKTTTTTLIGEMLKGSGKKGFRGREYRQPVDRLCRRAAGRRVGRGRNQQLPAGGRQRIPAEDQRRFST